MTAEDAFAALAERIADDVAHVAPRPYVVGVTGSVAVGKSTAARTLQALLVGPPRDLRVAVVATDGFLLPNAVLAERGLLGEKGFPVSFDLEALATFLAALRAGRLPVSAPVYSHERYDVVDDERLHVDEADVVVVEGLHLLADGVGPFDLTVYLDADEDDVLAWFLARFASMRAAAAHDPGSFYRRFSALSEDEADAFARDVWRDVNGRNLRHYIEPTRERADVVLRKDRGHLVQVVRPGRGRLALTPEGRRRA